MVGAKDFPATRSGPSAGRPTPQGHLQAPRGPGSCFKQGCRTAKTAVGLSAVQRVLIHGLTYTTIGLSVLLAAWLVLPHGAAPPTAARGSPLTSDVARDSTAVPPDRPPQATPGVAIGGSGHRTLAAPPELGRGAIPFDALDGPRRRRRRSGPAQAPPGGRVRRLHPGQHLLDPQLRRALPRWRGDLQCVRGVVGQPGGEQADGQKAEMRWTPKGAHLLLQVRTRVLNDELGDAFRRWYPEVVSAPKAALAA